MVSFALQKLLHLIRSHLFISVFIFITSWGGSKKILPQFMSKSVLPVFSTNGYDIGGSVVEFSPAYVFCQEFYSVWPYIQVFNPFWVYFCVSC